MIEIRDYSTDNTTMLNASEITAVINTGHLRLIAMKAGNTYKTKQDIDDLREAIENDRNN